MCSGTGFEAFGLRYSASMPERFIGVEVVILCWLGQGLFALGRRHRDLSLERRAVIPVWSSRHGPFVARSILLPNRREIDPLDQSLGRFIRGKSTWLGGSGILNRPAQNS